jgi:TonB-linked SusC/RagA family outer membrane protein
MRKLLFLAAVFLYSGLQVAMAQGRPVKGRVLDEKGEGVPGASITVKGTTTGTITDADGNFSLEVPDEKSTLVVNGIGYGQQEVLAGDGDNAISVKLGVSSKTLDEAVVVGYGTSTKKTLIGGASVIKEKAFKDVPVGNFTNMLQGKAPGVQITGQNGAPGGGAYIRIRGVGSISAGQEPLIVIDGVPATTDAYSALSQNDIADVSVLKDASTTAIYGSRGSNGVILVTTKKGGAKGAPPRITYGFQYGVKNKTKDNFRMMNFAEKLKFERDLGYTNEYLAPLLEQDSLNSITEAEDPSLYWNQLKPYETDWLKQLLRTGRYSQHDISVSGSTEKVDYYFALQSYNEDGISLASNFKRKSGTFNVDYKATDWLKIGQSIRVSQYSTQDLRDRFNAQNPFNAMYSYNPYEAPYDFTSNGINGYNPTTAGFNIIEALRTNPSSANTVYGASTTFLELTPIKKLILRTQLGLQYSNRATESFTRPGSILDGYVNGSKPTGSKTDGGNNTFNYVWTNTAEYKTSFAEAHSLRLLIGTEFTENKFKSYSLNSTGYPLNPDLSTQNNGATPVSTSTSREGWTMLSMFARAEYNYLGKYLANISVRRDGSSRFGKNVRYANFIAGGVAWNMTEESFLKSANQVSLLKLWASVGTSGNNQIGNYTALPLYKSGSYSDQVTFYPNAAVDGGPGNISLTWEKNTNYSLGLDFAFFNNRLAGSIDYYNRYTHALLLDRPLSATTGYTYQLGNVGSMRNSGLEFNINYDIVKEKDFQWSVGGNITLNKNRIVKLATDADIPNGSTRYSIGKPIDVYYLQKYAGVDPSTGDELWYKKDGTTTNDYKQADLFILDNKSPDPKFYGGLNTAVSYKGVQLSIDFYYSGGNYIYNQIWQEANSAENINSNMAADALDYWTPQNTSSKNPKANKDLPSYSSDRWLQDGSFIRLRNVTLAYNLPTSLISKLKMQVLRVYVQGQNLWYHAPEYKGDPEVGMGSAESGATRPGARSLYSYPQTKAITFGLNVTF